MFLKKKTVLGHLDYMSSVIPVEVNKIKITSNKVPEKYAVFSDIISNLAQPKMPSEEHQQLVVKKIYLFGLTYEQREKKENY